MATVLIVDDEPNIRRMVGALLSGEGHEVKEAANGAQGLTRASEIEPDAVLLDLMMPGELDGIAVLRHVNEHLPGMKVVIVTGYATSDLVKEARALGAAGFVVKPFNAATVLSTVHAALERQAETV